jgi:signal transduction histidine kinase
LTDVIDSLGFLAAEKGLVLHADIAEPLTLVGDPDALLRLFANLLDNAIEYTAQGQITARASLPTNGWLSVSVQDTGIGIAAEHLPHLFDRFYQVDPTRTQGGFGLGLAIAQQIAHIHGGAIEVTSQVGCGTTFIVRLPSQDGVYG